MFISIEYSEPKILTWNLHHHSPSYLAVLFWLREKLARHHPRRPRGSSHRSLLFSCAIFSRLFRLSLAPTICPWVSEDGSPCTSPRLSSEFCRTIQFSNCLVVMSLPRLFSEATTFKRTFF